MNYRILLLLILLPLVFSCKDTKDFLNDVSNPGSSPYVAIGDSLTAGVQSDGIVDYFQFNSFPYLISRQLGVNDFEQPTVNPPGIGFEPGKTPLMYNNGVIFRNNLNVNDPTDLFDNFFLDRPYDNLGIPGARLVDVQSTSQLLFELVLRGMGTQLEQAIELDPGLVTLWIGSNDVLGAAKQGGDLSKITPSDQFESDFHDILDRLTTQTNADIVVANIANVTDIPFVNFLNRVFRTIPQLGINEPVPVVFGQDFNPIDFGNGLYIPLTTQETNVDNLLVSFLNSYINNGSGIPDQQKLMDLGLSMSEASNIVSQMQAAGLNPSGTAIPGGQTLNTAEKTSIQDSVNEFNDIISSEAANYSIPVVDINGLLTEINQSGIDGYTGNFVLEDPENTAFSLDGVHPDNAGYAIIANRFIQKINQSYGMTIPLIDTQQFRGQYSN